MNHTLATHTKDDIIRAYRVLCQRDADSKQIKVLHDDVSNVHHVVLGNTIIYTLEPVDRELYFHYRLPEIQQKVHFTVDTFASQLLGAVDTLNGKRRASDDNYNLIPAFIEHCFDLFAVIDSAKLTEQVGELTVKYFNMCHHLSNYNINFQLSHLAARRPVENVNDIVPGIEEFTKQLADSELKTSDTNGSIGEMAQEADVEENQRPSTDDLPEDNEYEVTNNEIKAHEWGVHIHDGITSGVTEKPVDEVVIDEEPVDNTPEWLKEKPPAPKVTQRVGFNHHELITKVTTNLLAHPLINILSGINRQITRDDGSPVVDLKLVEMGSDLDALFDPRSDVNPVSFVELIAYDFTMTYPQSSDEELLKTFIHGKVKEYLPVMLDDALLRIKDDDFRSVYYLTDPAKWVFSAKLDKVIDSLLSSTLYKFGGKRTEFSEGELLAVDMITCSKPTQVRATINKYMVDGDLVIERYAENDHTVQSYTKGNWYTYSTLSDEGKTLHLTFIDVCNTAVNIVACIFNFDEEVGAWVLGKTSKREFTRSKDVSDVILVVADALGFNIIPSTPANVEQLS